MSDSPKLSYLKGQFRVRCEVHVAHVRAQRTAPEDLIVRTKTKLAAEKNNGGIDTYIVYPEKLAALWKRMASLKLPEGFVVGLTLGVGAPKFPGLTLKPDESGNSLCLISLQSGIMLNSAATFRLLQVHVESYLKATGVSATPDAAVLQAYYLKALTGQPVSNQPIPEVPLGGLAGILNSQGFWVAENPDRTMITLIIGSVQKVASKGVWGQLKQAIWGMVDMRATQEEGSYHFFYDDIVRKLRSARRGPEQFGIDVPMVMLAAIDSRFAQIGGQKAVAKPPGSERNSPSTPAKPTTGVSEKNALADSRKKQATRPQTAAMSPAVSPAVSPARAKPAAAPAGPVMDIAEQDQNMMAVIVGFGPKLGENQPDDLSIDWVISELNRLGISKDAYEQHLAAISDALRDGSPICGMTIATGEVGKAGQDPYVALASAGAENASGGEIDMSNSAPLEFAHKGDLIARLMYGVPAKPSIDVYGKISAPPQGEAVPVKLSEGVVEKKPGEFYAKIDGTPRVEGFEVSIEAGLVHKGNVNVTSGRISLKGNVSIEGSVAAGGEIDVVGDVRIAGSISGGEIIVRGNLKVENGMNTAPKGFVNASGNMDVKFTENSDFYCGGNFTAEKGITSCEGIIKGNVRANLISAGSLYVGGNVQCVDLGKERSPITRLFLGVDRIAKQAIETRKERLAKLTASLRGEKKELRALSRRSEAQLTPKHRDRLEELQEFTERLAVIVGKAKEHLENAEANLKYDTSGHVIIEGVLAAGTMIYFGKRFVRVQDSVREVGVAYTRSTGISIMDLADLKDSLAMKKTNKAS